MSGLVLRYVISNRFEEGDVFGYVMMLVVYLMLCEYGCGW